VHRLWAILTLASSLAILSGCESSPFDRYPEYGGTYRPYAAPAYPREAPLKRGYGWYDEGRSAPMAPSSPQYDDQADERSGSDRFYSYRGSRVPYGALRDDDGQQEEDRLAPLPYEDPPTDRPNDDQRGDRDLQAEPRNEGRPSLGLPTWR
jgi:hypothetical protein